MFTVLEDFRRTRSWVEWESCVMLVLLSMGASRGGTDSSS